MYLTQDMIAQTNLVRNGLCGHFTHLVVQITSPESLREPNMMFCGCPPTSKTMLSLRTETPYSSRVLGNQRSGFKTKMWSLDQMALGRCCVRHDKFSKDQSHTVMTE
jgi:hypothetical protein